MERTDDDLVNAAQRGDREACDLLLRRHQPMIWAVCRRIIGDQHSAADASQEALIAVVRNIGRFDGRSQVRTWMYRIATNAALDELRRQRRRPDAIGDDVVAERKGSTLERTHQVDDRLLIEDALARLPLEFRTAVVLRDLVDLDYAQIGDILGIPAGTVRSRIARGRNVLAKHLADRGGNHPSHGDRPTIDPSEGLTPEAPSS